MSSFIDIVIFWINGGVCVMVSDWLWGFPTAFGDRKGWSEYKQERAGQDARLSYLKDVFLTFMLMGPLAFFMPPMSFTNQDPDKE